MAAEAPTCNCVPCTNPHRRRRDRLRGRPGERACASRGRHRDRKTRATRPPHSERMDMSTTTVEPPALPISAKTGIWGRQLARYPSNGPRAFYLGIVIIATIVLYYELFVQGAVATKLLTDLDMSLTYF